MRKPSTQKKEGSAAAKPWAASRPALRLLQMWALPVLGLALLVGVWQATVTFFSIPAWKLPAPSAIVNELMVSRALFFKHTWVTLSEALYGLALAFLFSVVVAAAMAFSRTFQRTVYPLLIASQTIPIIVVAPLLLIWVGYGLAPKIIVVVLVTFFPLVVNTMDGLRSVEPDMMNMMRTLGARRWQIFTKVQAPTALPYLFSGAKIAATFSIIGAIIGEWVGASAGLGYLTRSSVPLFLTARSFGAVVILALLGIGLFLIVALVERLALPWQYNARRAKALEEDW